MNDESNLGRLVQWRQEQAEHEAPPAPRASRLLALSRPWWEEFPERSRALLDRLAGMQVVYGHAKVETLEERAGHAVPALWVSDPDEIQTSVQVLYLSVRANQLRLRFKVAAPVAVAGAPLEVLLVSEGSRPVTSAMAQSAVGAEYRVEFDLPEVLAEIWAALKVTDKLPFRFVLGPTVNSA